MNSWGKAIGTRFANRNTMTPLELYGEFWSDLPQKEVLAALRTIEEECEVTVGLMRPTDTMATLSEPPATKNPLLWMEYQVHGGDLEFELARQLTKRLRKYGRMKEWRNGVLTLDDFVRAWCGEPHRNETRR